MTNGDVSSAFPDLPYSVLIKRMEIMDRNNPEYISDELIFSLFQQSRKLNDKTRIGPLSNSLSKRILIRAKGFVRKTGIYPTFISDFQIAAMELSQFFWEKLLTSGKDAAQAEKTFGQVFKRRAIDFQRRFYAKKRKDEESSDALDYVETEDEFQGEENSDTYIDEFDELGVVMLKILSASELAVLEMRYKLGMQVNEIAQALNKTPKSIFNYTKSAITKLKKELSND